MSFESMPAIQPEALARLGSFVVILAVMSCWELVAPLRKSGESRFRHDARNLAILLLDTAIVRILLPIVPVGLASIASARGWGILGQFPVPGWLAVLLTVVVFDFAIYIQHVLFHAIPALWRLHMVHHSDLDFDTTTGVRFHPIEILLSAGIKMGLVLVLGPPAVGVMLFEIILNGTALFNHANVQLPRPLDRYLRWALVTPDMHRVHHSADRPETNSNFGFNLPWWDRLFGTYVDQPAAGHENMTIGLDEYRDHRDVTLGRLLMLPFSGSGGGYAIGRKR